MNSVHRLGDPNTVGGNVTQSVLQSKFFINDILVSVDGSCVTGHPPGIAPHAPTCVPKTANGSLMFLIEDIPVNAMGDSDTCGHARANGSPNFFIG